MSTETATQEEAAKAVYAYAASLVREGQTEYQVKCALELKGLSPETAEAVTSDLFKVRQEAVSKAGQKNMLFGALWCIGGTLVTVISYSSAASSSGGGSYVVAWGAIVFGAIQFLKGLGQRLDNQ